MGVVDDDCPDVNLTGTYAEDGFAVEKLVDVYNANLFAGGVVSIAWIISHLDAKCFCFLYDLLR